MACFYNNFTRSGSSSCDRHNKCGCSSNGSICMENPKRPDEFCSTWRYPKTPTAPTLASPSQLQTVDCGELVFMGIATPCATVTVTIDFVRAKTIATEPDGIFILEWPYELAPGLHKACVTQDYGCDKSEPTCVLFYTTGCAMAAPTIIGPAQGAAVVAPPTFYGTANPYATVSIEMGGIIRQTVADANGNYSYTWTDPLTAGPQTACISQQISGESSPSSCVTFTLLGSVNPLTITNPQEGAVTGTMPVFTGFAAPNSSVNIAIGFVNHTAMTDQAGAFSMQWPEPLPVGPTTACVTQLLTSTGNNFVCVNFTVA